MKIAFFALLTVAGSATARAGIFTTNPLPDAGSSLLLLGIGVAAIGFACRAFRR